MGTDRTRNPSPSLRPALPPTLARGRPQRVPYKVVVALFPHQWAELRTWCDAREVGGAELVSTIINDWLLAHPNPPQAPTPEPSGDDENDVEPSQLGC